MLAPNKKKKKVKSKRMYQQDCSVILVHSDNPPSLSVLVCPEERRPGGRVGQSLTEARESGSV